MLSLCVFSCYLCKDSVLEVEKADHVKQAIRECSKTLDGTINDGERMKLTSLTRKQVYDKQERK